MATNPLFSRAYVVSPLGAQTYEVRSGNVYSSDGTGFVALVSSLHVGDLTDLLNAGCVLKEVPWLGRLISANMNVTTDQAITLDVPIGVNFRITKITAINASTSLTTAAGGVYSAVSKGGDAIVANTQAYSGLTGNTLALDLTIATTPGKTVYNQATVPAAVFSLTTAQGAAATADIYAYGDVYW